jgi:hypothetical protein
VQALVFIGDACEENPDTLCAAARRLGQVRLPVFLFQEGDDQSHLHDRTTKVFKDIARLTHGAHCPAPALVLDISLSACCPPAA